MQYSGKQPSQPNKGFIEKWLHCALNKPQQTIDDLQCITSSRGANEKSDTSLTAPYLIPLQMLSKWSIITKKVKKTPKLQESSQDKEEEEPLGIMCESKERERVRSRHSPRNRLDAIAHGIHDGNRRDTIKLPNCKIHPKTKRRRNQWESCVKARKGNA